MSPLLAPLLAELPEVFNAEVLPRLTRVDRTMLAQVGWPWRAAVLASGLPRTRRVVRLKLADFVGSVDRLAWRWGTGVRATR